MLLTVTQFSRQAVTRDLSPDEIAELQGQPTPPVLPPVSPARSQVRLSVPSARSRASSPVAPVSSPVPPVRAAVPLVRPPVPLSPAPPVGSPTHSAPALPALELTAPALMPPSQPPSMSANPQVMFSIVVRGLLM
ncbi:hypothetical protein HWV62_39788 [Athelia sp. TMB]|nr:hypothetical protein HWV62_39788 [Athelia sp. TMB]